MNDGQVISTATLAALQALTPLPLPAAKVALSFRVATVDDVPFIDALQKANSKGLGYFPTAQLVGYIENGAVLLAEEVASGRLPVASEEKAPPTPALATDNSQLATPLGYIISRDRYLKRDELGVIYQLCVAPGDQRKLIGAALVQEVFNRSAYGCCLYCLWCAQDLPANHFWESLGFVPIAFRGGSDRKKRVHIFWQKRIDQAGTKARRRPEAPREGTKGGESDDGEESSPTPNGERRAPAPYWYPFKTDSGALRADRLVFPIPPATHWSEVKAVQLPVDSGQLTEQLPVASCQLPERKKRVHAASLATDNRQMATASSLATGTQQLATHSRINGLYFGPPAPVLSGARGEKRVGKARAKAVRGPATRIDPKFLAATRELRDRWMEEVNMNGADRLLERPAKYAVHRLPAPVNEARLERVERTEQRLLAA